MSGGDYEKCDNVMVCVITIFMYLSLLLKNDFIYHSNNHSENGQQKRK